MKRIRFARSAVSDLDAIWMFAAERDGIEIAQRLVESLIQRIAMLGLHPLAGIERADLGEGVRSFVVRPFRVYYRVARGVVRILHIRHGSQDESSLVKR